MDKFSRFQPGRLGHHQSKQSIGGNVERNTQENVATALVHLAGELAVGHIKLEQKVTGWQGI